MTGIIISNNDIVNIEKENGVGALMTNEEWWITSGWEEIQLKKVLKQIFDTTLKGLVEDRR